MSLTHPTKSNIELKGTGISVKHIGLLFGIDKLPVCHNFLRQNQIGQSQQK